MRIINPRAFIDAEIRFPQKKAAIANMRALLGRIKPKNSAELKAVLPSLEKYPGRANCYRIDVGGRRGLRMIAVIEIRAQSVYIYLLGSHDEYDGFKFRN